MEQPGDEVAREEEPATQHRATNKVRLTEVHAPVLWTTQRHDGVHIY